MQNTSKGAGLDAQLPSYRDSRPETAAADLAQIRSYLRRRSGERAASRMIARLRDIFELLAEQPRMGVERPFLPGMRIHFVSRTRYIILYFPHKQPI